MTDLHGKSVLVAGGSGSLGRRIAAELAQRGARLGLFARHQEGLVDTGLDAVMTAGDIGLPQDCQRAVGEMVARYGRLDGLVNAAGIVAFGQLADLDDDTLEELFITNCFGPLRLVRAALPHLEGGFVVNLSAVVAERPLPGMVAYSASKAALTAADQALQRELRGSRIRVVDVRPPHTETGLASRPIAGEAPKLPTGLDPDDVARRIVEAIAVDARDVASSDFSELPPASLQVV